MILQTSLRKIYFFARWFKPDVAHGIVGVFLSWLGLWERAYNLAGTAGGDHVD